jgi:glutamate formiminotransferase/formiminotetrahydrofolate cyclodeaminase
MGAFMNVRINASGYDDAAFVADVLKRGKEIEDKAKIREAEILGIVNSKIGV